MGQEARSSEASVASSSPAASSWWETITTTNSSILMSSSSTCSLNAPAMINQGRTWKLPNNSASKYSCHDDEDDDDIEDQHISIVSTNSSFTNPSLPNHSSETHLWNQVPLGFAVLGNSEQAAGVQQQTISSQKNFIRSALMFDHDDPAAAAAVAACDLHYLKKLNGTCNWEFNTTSNINSSAHDHELSSSSTSSSLALEKQLINISGLGEAAGDHHDNMPADHHNYNNSESRQLIIRSSNYLTDLVSNWSIAPPNYPQHHQYIKHIEEAVPAARGSSTNIINPLAFQYSYSDQDALHQNENGRGSCATGSTFASAGLAANYKIGPVIGLKNTGLLMADDAACSSNWTNIINSIPRNLSVAAADHVSFSPSSIQLLNKQQPALMELRGLSSSTRQGNKIYKAAAAGGHQHDPSSSSSSYSNRKGSGGGRRDQSGTSSQPCEDRIKKKTTTTHHHCTSDMNTPTCCCLFKKPKHVHDHTSTATTATTTSPPPLIIKSQLVQAPNKVKVGDKITALQQLVSPFGKTDTASVLLEAIKYIRFLQEQVQLLSDPYLKSNANKDHMMSSWPGMMEIRKEKADPKHDLRGRGLCLVPISCTPQDYRENSTGPDYWTPPFRGYLYR